MLSLHEWAARWGIPEAALRDFIPESVPGATGSESKAQADIQMAVARAGGRLLRNNSGAATDPSGRPVRFGLGNTSAAVNRAMKSSDLIGWLPDGRFLAIEVKAPGWKYRGTPREQAQLNFIKLVIAFGGWAQFATCVEDLKWITEI